MSIKRKFLICSVVMLVIPVLLILLLSAMMVTVFAVAHPTVELSLTEGVSVSNPVMLRFFILWALMAAVVVAVTGLVITGYLSRSILRPLRELNTAMIRMREGELNYEFSGSADRELQELCQSFEALRLQLQKTVEENLSYEKEQRMLLANISHDIKTPITSIRGYVEGILDGVANTPEKMERYLRTIRAKAAAVELMADNLSLYSKLEMKRVLYHMEITDIFALILEVTREFELELQSAGMELTYDIEPGTAPVKLDREKMRRVFANLITNAIKYKRPGRGSLCVSARLAQRRVVIRFADRGAGIAPEDLDRVFEGFYRGDPSRNSKIEGNGLGLAICREIVQDHSGKIWIRSEVDRGTEVIILLPCAEPTRKDGDGHENTNH